MFDAQSFFAIFTGNKADADPRIEVRMVNLSIRSYLAAYRGLKYGGNSLLIHEYNFVDLVAREFEKDLYKLYYDYRRHYGKRRGYGKKRPRIFRGDTALVDDFKLYGRKTYPSGSYKQTITGWFNERPLEFYNSYKGGRGSKANIRAEYEGYIFDYELRARFATRDMRPTRGQQFETFKWSEDRRADLPYASRVPLEIYREDFTINPYAAGTVGMGSTNYLYFLNHLPFGADKMGFGYSTYGGDFSQEFLGRTGCDYQFRDVYERSYKMFIYKGLRRM